MRTDSTFKRGPLVALADAVPELADAEVDPDDALPSIVPVISTLWPTCEESWLSCASRRYVLPEAVPDPDADDPLGDGVLALEPEGADELDEPDVLLVAFVRMN